MKTDKHEKLELTLARQECVIKFYLEIVAVDLWIGWYFIQNLKEKAMKTILSYWHQILRF